MKTWISRGERRLIRLALPLLLGIVGGLLFVPSSLVKPHSAAAYDVGPPVGKSPVHETMAKEALDLYGVQFFNNVEDGIRHEDGLDHVYGQNLDIPLVGMPLVTASHFWEPDKGLDAPTHNAEALSIVGPLIPEPFRSFLLGDSLTFPNAWVKANALWSLALGAYANGNKPMAYHYFGHVVHLLGDLTVPAHAHDDPHGPTWFDDDAYHVWMDTEGSPPPHAALTEAERIDLEGKGLIKAPDTHPNKLLWLFYTTQQVADLFASDDVDGNANDPLALGPQDDVFRAIVNDADVIRLRDRSELADNDGCPFPRSPICGSANDDDGDLTLIRKHTYLRGVRAVAGLYQLFEQTASKQLTLTVVIDRVEQDEWHDYFPYPCPVVLGVKGCVEVSDPDLYARVTVAGRESRNRGDRVENTDDFNSAWAFGNTVGTTGTAQVKVEILDEDGAHWDPDPFTLGGADDDSDVDGDNGREDLDLELDVDLAKCLRREPGAISGDLTGTCGASLSQAGDSSLEASLVRFRIFMSNSPPTAEAGGPYTTNEGTNVTLDGSGSTDPDNDIATYAWDFDGDGACDDATGAKPDFTAVGQDGPPITVKLCVTDAVGLTDDDTATVTVNNVAPTINASANTPKSENTSVTVSGTVTDPGWLDSLSGTISWGDGSAVQALSGTLENVRPNATLTFSNSHTYGDNGTWTVQVCAKDDDTNPCTSFSVSIDNTAPTAMIDLSGAVTVNGTPTVIARAGQAVAFSGRSTDPGSDDLTLEWAWGDGTAGTSTTSRVNPPNPDPPQSPSIQPRDIPSSPSHTFAGACVYETNFTATDDDTGSNAAKANVIIVGNGSPNNPHGWWKQEVRFHATNTGPKPAFTAERMTCYLRIAGYMSRVFDEKTAASTFAQAADVLDTSSTSDINELFDQQLLAVWLNFANGAIAWDRLVDTNGDRVADTRFLDAVTVAETLRLNPNATQAQLDQQKRILERWTNLP